MLVKYNQTNILIAGRVKFIPGINNVDHDKWLEISENPQILSKMEDGILTVLTQASENGDDSASLAKFKSKEAIKLVKDTVEVGLLKLWQSEEKRGDVLASIQGQIDKILKPSEKKKLEKDSD